MVNKYVICSYRVREFRHFSDKSDVYSFGVFLLELMSGQEAMKLLSSDSNQNLVEWVSSSSHKMFMHTVFPDLNKPMVLFNIVKTIYNLEVAYN